MRGLQRLSGLGPLCERLLSGSQLPTLSAAGEIAFRVSRQYAAAAMPQPVEGELWSTTYLRYLTHKRAERRQRRSVHRPSKHSRLRAARICAR